MNQLVALAMPGGSLFTTELRRAWDESNAIFPLDLRLPSAAQESMLDAMGVRAVIDANGDTHQRANGWPVEHGDALVIATSGTTGEPKGVVHTHDGLMASANITSAALGVTADDKWIACLPLSHIGGFSVVTRAMLNNTRYVVLPGFDPTAVETEARAGATLVSLVNTAMRRVNTNLFRKILLGGAAPPPDRPGNAVVTWGMTETGSGVVYDHYPLTGVELKTDNDGQLLVRSATLIRCYRDGSDPKTNEGWFATGDSAEIGDSNRLNILGRMDDAINTGGEKVWPTAVEQIGRLHPAVKEALVFGIPDEEWGQRVVIALQVTPGFDAPTLEEIRDYVKATLPAYCCPKELRVVKGFDRTASGKVKRPSR